MENPVQKRSTKFVKGQSGNPLGRPKGSKNKITMMKLALEGDLRAQIRPHMAEILEIAVNMAKKGDTSMIKLLLDKTLPTTKASDDEAPAKEKVQIFIDRLPDRGGGRAPVTIDGQIVSDDEDGE